MAQDDQPPYSYTDTSARIFTAKATRRSPNETWRYTYDSEPPVHVMRPQIDVIRGALAQVRDGSLPAELVLVSGAALRLLLEGTSLFTPDHLAGAELTESTLTTCVSVEGDDLVLTIPANPVMNRAKRASVIVLDAHGNILSKQ